MNVSDILQQHAQRHPHRIAMIGAHQQVSYAELEAQANHHAQRFQQVGVKLGSRVLVLIPMGIALYAALAGLWKLGAVAIFIDPSMGIRSFRQSLQDVPPDAMIGIAKAHLLRLVCPELQHIPCLFAPLKPSQPVMPAITAVASQSSNPALITFTSGSTGVPKAAIRSHGLLWAQYQSLQNLLQLDPSQIHMCTLPIVSLMVLGAGGTALIPAGNLSKPADVATAPILQQIQKYQPSTLSASPAFIKRLASATSSLPFKQVYLGGAPVFPKDLEWLSHVARDAEFFSVFGSTEAEPIAMQAYRNTLDTELSAMRAGRGLLAGFPVEGLQLRILPDQTHTTFTYPDRAFFDLVSLPSNQIGEIVVSGAHVVPSYLNPANNTLSKWQDEHGTTWHRTGDAGYLDDQGRLWLMGRCSAKIEDAYGTIYPFSVEIVAQNHPNVRRAALTQVQGRRVLWIEWQGTPDIIGLQNMLTWAQVNIHSIDKIPLDRRHNAKIDYTRLPKFLG